MGLWHTKIAAERTGEESDCDSTREWTVPRALFLLWVSYVLLSTLEAPFIRPRSHPFGSRRVRRLPHTPLLARLADLCSDGYLETRVNVGSHERTSAETPPPSALYFSPTTSATRTRAVSYTKFWHGKEEAATTCFTMGNLGVGFSAVRSVWTLRTTCYKELGLRHSGEIALLLDKSQLFEVCLLRSALLLGRRKNLGRSLSNIVELDCHSQRAGGEGRMDHRLARPLRCRRHLLSQQNCTRYILSFVLSRHMEMEQPACSR